MESSCGSSGGEENESEKQNLSHHHVLLKMYWICCQNSLWAAPTVFGAWKDECFKVYFPIAIPKSSLQG